MPLADSPQKRSTPEDIAVMRCCGARLKAARLAQHLSQEALGLQVGLSGASISELERGHLMTSPAKVAKIARVLGLSLDVLFDLPTRRVNATPQQWEFFRRFLTMDPQMQAAVEEVVKVHTRDQA